MTRSIEIPPTPAEGLRYHKSLKGAVRPSMEVEREIRQIELVSDKTLAETLRQLALATSDVADFLRGRGWTVRWDDAGEVTIVREQKL